MYTPSHFELTSRSALFQIMRSNPFITLMVNGPAGPELGHVPVVVDPDEGAQGTLRFHLAAANPMLAALRQAHQAVAVFTGPHAYISPHWYDSHDMVPTWNYVVIHAHGQAQELNGHGLTRLLDDLTASSESVLDKPAWTRETMDAEAFRRMLGAIAGFRMPIEALHGKAKLGQNRKPADREAAAKALLVDPHPDRRQLAHWMKDGLG